MGVRSTLTRSFFLFELMNIGPTLVIYTVALTGSFQRDLHAFGRPSDRPRVKIKGL
jgi:hypothetical protein